VSIRVFFFKNIKKVEDTQGLMAALGKGDTNTACKDLKQTMYIGMNLGVNEQIIKRRFTAS